MDTIEHQAGQLACAWCGSIRRASRPRRRAA